MPEFTALHLAMLASLFVVGIGLGWLLRSDRCARERIAINAGWQEQLENRQAENDRLIEQNRGLMQQVSEQQASGTDSAARAKDLSASLEQALRERDEWRRELAALRSRLDVTVAEHERLQKELQENESRLAAASTTLKEKDDKIFRLSRSLSGWQSRLPPLVEKFKEREQELQSELDRAVNRIAELETMTRPDETRIEAIDDDALGRLDASNDQYGDAAGRALTGVEDRDDAWLEALSPDESFAAALDTDDADFSEPVSSAPAPDGRDDLQRIRGVGPAIEKTLNELGIWCFEQIAEISEYDIERVAARLRGFRSRIYRENWIGQARALTRAKDPDPE